MEGDQVVEDLWFELQARSAASATRIPAHYDFRLSGPQEAMSDRDG